MARSSSKPKTEAEWLDSLPDEYIYCRDTTLRHKWEVFSAKRQGDAVFRIVQCERCGSRKDVLIGNDGLPAKSKSPSYPDGYLRPPGTGRITAEENAEIRAETNYRLLKPKRRRKAS